MTAHLSLITAVVDPAALLEVIDELRRAGMWGVTVAEVRDFGDGPRRAERYRGTDLIVDFTLRVKLELVVEIFDAERIAELVAVTAGSTRSGGGTVSISHVAELRRIRTGEMGLDAL